MSVKSIKNAALVAGSLLVSLIVLGAGFELFLRIRHERWKSENEQDLGGSLFKRSENPRLIWENRPGFTEEHLAINRWGFRDVDLESKKKPADVYRIAFVGDSVTLGRGVEKEELFTALFGSGTPMVRGRRVQAMNFSVGGYSALQIAELVRAKAVDFEPDMVVYVLCLNDFALGSDNASGQLMRYFRPPRSFLWERLVRAQDRRPAHDYHSLHFSKNRREVFESIERVHGHLDERRIGFQVVILPVFDFSVPSFREYTLGEIHDATARFLVEKGIRGLDLLATFSACSKLPPWAYALDVWHLNPLGHRFVARSLSDLLAPEDAPAQVSEQTCADLQSLESAEAATKAAKLEPALSSGQNVRLGIDSPVLQLEEFWPIEGDARSAFAWSRGTSFIDISHLRPGATYSVTLLRVDSAARLNASAGPRNGPRVNVTFEGSDLRLPTPSTADANGRVTVELHVETFRPSTRGSADKRLLGVALTGVAVQLQ